MLQLEKELVQARLSEAESQCALKEMQDKVLDIEKVRGCVVPASQPAGGIPDAVKYLLKSWLGRDVLHMRNYEYELIESANKEMLLVNTGR